MKVYNKNQMDIRLHPASGEVLLRGAWNRLHDKEQNAIEGKWGVTELDDKVWAEISNEYKENVLFKTGQIFVAKSDNEANAKVDDSDKPKNSRKSEADLLKEGSVGEIKLEEFGS